MPLSYVIKSFSSSPFTAEETELADCNLGCKGISFNGFFLESYIHSINNLEMSRDAAGFAKYNYKTKVNTFNMVPTDKML